ncbi:MAG TPA: DMT family transporter [Candidatus Tectomicrobia bacterium]|nr:DMT family transporter [Candidatus Tectomicrobia bacterium]
MSGWVPALALGSALLSATATILIRQGLRRYGPYTGFWINLVVGTVCVWAAVLATGGPGRPSATGVAYFALAGLVGTVAGRLLRFISIETVGASIAAALMNLSPLVSSGLAVLLLGERVTLPVAVGTLVIVTGTTLLSAGGKRIGVRPVQLVLPVLSAVCFGLVAVIRKVGLADIGSVVGMAVNVTTALVAFTAFLLASGQRAAMACRGRSLAIFIAAGVAENLAVFLIIVALGLGTVSVVAPLMNVSPIFVLFLSLAFLRGIEVLNARIVAGTLLTVLGAGLITALSGR